MTVDLKVDKNFVKLNDEVTYTLVVKNDEEDVKELCIVMPIHENLTFKWIQINDVFYTDKSFLEKGVGIKQLAAWETVEISFVGVLEKFPEENPIMQMADVFYTIAKEPCTLTSNVVMSYAVDANITCVAESFVIQADKKVVDKGEVYTYCVHITNKGNKKAEQILTTHLAPEGTCLLGESYVQVQGEGSLTPEGSVCVASLEVGETCVFSYEVQVDDVFKTQVIRQALQMQYQLLYPNRQYVLQKSISNSVEVAVKTVCLSGATGTLSMQSSAHLVTEGDRVTYTLQGYNMGTVTTNQVYFVDILQKGIRLVEGSLQINGKSVEGWTQISNQIAFQERLEISPKAAFSISYQVEVLEGYPIQDTLQAMPKLGYSYVVGDRVVEQQVSIPTDGVQVVLAYLVPSQAQLLMGLERVITLGEVVDATLDFTNKGNVAAQGIEVVLDLPECITIQDQSWVYKENKWHKKYSSFLEVEHSHKEILQLKVIDIPKNLKERIQAQVIYAYAIGADRIEWVSLETCVVIAIEAACIESECVHKSFEPIDVCVGETVVCHIEVTNKGNIPAYDIVLQEESIPEVCFLEENKGIFGIQQLMPGEITTISYRIQVLGLPPTVVFWPTTQVSYSYTNSQHQNYTKQTCITEKGIYITDAYISPFAGEINVQYVEKNTYAKGECAKYTFMMMNLGNAVAKQVKIMLPDVPYGIWQNMYPMVPEELKPGQQFLAKYALDITQIPTSGLVEVAPSISYAFQVNHHNEDKTRTVYRNYTIDPIQIGVECAIIEEGHGLTKNVDTLVAAVDDVVYYTVSVQNTGNIKAIDIQLKEYGTKGILYQPDTLYVNEKVVLGDPFQEGVRIGKLEAGEQCSIRYGVKVVDMPEGGQFATYSVVNYACYVGAERYDQQVESRSISVQVEDPYIQLITDQDGYNLLEQHIDWEEGVEFKVLMQALGNTKAYEMVYTIETEGISFEPRYDRTGLDIQELQPNQMMRLAATGTLCQFPTSGYYKVRGKLCYKFGVGIHQKQRVIYTEYQNIYVYAAGPLHQEAFGLKVGQEVLHIGELITLNFYLNAEGNCKMEQTKLYIKGMEDLGLQIQKIYTQESTYPVSNIDQGLYLGHIEPETQLQITIEGISTKIPVQPLNECQGILEYSSLGISSKQAKNYYKQTKTSRVVLRESGLSSLSGITLTADKKALRQGEQIQYTLRLDNTGNAKTQHIKAHLEIDSRLKVDPASLYVKGAVCTGDVDLGLYIEQLDCGEFVEIQFIAELSQMMPQDKIWVKGSVIYEYIDGYDKLKVCERDIPMNLVAIESADFGKDYFKVWIEKEEYMLEQQLYGKIHIQNGGNKKAEAVSVFINLPESFEWVSPKEIIEIGDLEPMQVHQIEFKAIAKSLTQKLSYINAELTYKDRGEMILVEGEPLPCKCMCPIIQIKGHMSEESAIVGDEITYTLEITNKGNQKATSLHIQDLVQQEVDYVADSLKHNKLCLEEILQVQTNALTIDALEIGETFVLSYKGKIKRRPQESCIDYKVQVCYHYTLNNQLQKEAVTSDGRCLVVEDPEITLFKKCSQHTIQVGEDVEVVVKIVNTGSVDLDQVVLYDQLAEGMLFIEGSFKQDNQRQSVIDIHKGIGLGPLKRQEQRTISYKLRVNSYSTPSIAHKVDITYLFNKANLATSKKTSEQLIDTLSVVSPYKIEVNYSTQLFLAYEAPDLREIVKVEVTAEILEVQRTLENHQEVEIKGILNYLVWYEGGGACQHIQLKKVWGTHALLKYPKGNQGVDLQIETQKVHYAPMHKRALKVDVELVIYET